MPFFRSLALALTCGLSGTSAALFPQPEATVQAQPGDSSTQHSFAFQNDRAQPVVIRQIKTSCGCSAATADQKTYAPGAKGEVQLDFKFGDRVGLQEKKAYVYLEGETEPVVLTLHVEIPKPIAVTPRLVFWRLGEPAEAKAVTLQLAGMPGWQIKAVRPASAKFSAEFAPDTVPGVYRIKITPSATNTRTTSFVTLDLAGPDARTLTERVHAAIR